MRDRGARLGGGENACRRAAWLSGLLDTAEPLSGVKATLRVQVGGAAGTLAAIAELVGSVGGAVALSGALADSLRLVPAPPWHTARSPITRVGDLLVGSCDAWGHIAADVATGSRQEIVEFTEGRGGESSTMPHKSNPVRSVRPGTHVADVATILVADSAWRAYPFAEPGHRQQQRGKGDTGLAALLTARRVDKAIGAFPRQPDS